MTRSARALLGVIAGSLVLTCAALAADGSEREPPLRNGIQPVVIDQAAFPAAVREDRLQFWTGSFLAPSADFDGGAELGLTRAELRARARIPHDDAFILQVMADFRASFYDLDGNGPLYARCADCPAPDELYSATLVVQGGYRLNGDRRLFRADEQWALLGSLYGRARWEPGAFDDSLAPGLALALGYRVPGRLRLALGARVERALDGEGVKAGPWADLSWDITPRLQLRNRGLGVLLEYRPTRRVEVFLTAFRAVDRFRLAERPALATGATFRDRQFLVGSGVVVKLARPFWIWLEAGAIVDREVSLTARDERAGAARSDGVSPYFSVRAEIRP